MPASCDIHRYIHGIGMMKMLASTATIARHRYFQAATDEEDFAPRALDVPANPSHPGNVNPSPADDGDDGDSRNNGPTEIAQTEPEKLNRVAARWTRDSR